MKKEVEIKKEKINFCLQNGYYAKCPYGSGNKFIWDWQQDCFIEIISDSIVSQIEVNVETFSIFQNIENFICNNDDDPTIGETINVHVFNNLIYGFSTHKGTEFFHKKWKHIDFEKCGF